MGFSFENLFPFIDFQDLGEVSAYLAIFLAFGLASFLLFIFNLFAKKLAKKNLSLAQDHLAKLQKTQEQYASESKSLGADFVALQNKTSVIHGVFDNLPVPILTIENYDKIIDCNLSYEEFIGSQKLEVIESELFPYKDVRSEILANLPKNGGKQQVKRYVIQNDRRVLYKFVAVNFNDGANQLIYCINLDEEEQALIEAKSPQESLRNLADNLHSAVVILHKNGNVKFMNPSFGKIFSIMGGKGASINLEKLEYSDKKRLNIGNICEYIWGNIKIEQSKEGFIQEKLAKIAGSGKKHQETLILKNNCKLLFSIIPCKNGEVIFLIENSQSPSEVAYAEAKQPKETSLFTKFPPRQVELSELAKLRGTEEASSKKIPSADIQGDFEDGIKLKPEIITTEAKNITDSNFSGIFAEYGNKIKITEKFKEYVNKVFGEEKFKPILQTFVKSAVKYIASSNMPQENLEEGENAIRGLNMASDVPFLTFDAKNNIYDGETGIDDSGNASRHITTSQHITIHSMFIELSGKDMMQILSSKNPYHLPQIYGKEFAGLISSIQILNQFFEKHAKNVKLNSGDDGFMMEVA